MHVQHPVALAHQAFTAVHSLGSAWGTKGSQGFSKYGLSMATFQDSCSHFHFSTLPTDCEEVQCSGMTWMTLKRFVGQRWYSLKPFCHLSDCLILEQLAKMHLIFVADVQFDLRVGVLWPTPWWCIDGIHVSATPKEKKHDLVRFFLSTCWVTIHLIFEEIWEPCAPEEHIFHRTDVA